MVQLLRIPVAARAVSRRTLATALLRSVGIGVAGLFFLVLLLIAAYPWRSAAYFWDFRAFYDGGSAYLHGHSPYPAARLAALTNKQNFVYPLPVAGFFAPLALLPFWVGAALFTAVNVAALALTLRVLDVRDPRCYVVAFLALPSQYALKLGTIMPLLALLLALAWRFRDRARLAVPILALLVLAKVFLWPIGVWYLATRRIGAAIGACILAAGLVVVSTVPVGLAPLRAYPHLLSVLSGFESSFSWSLTSLGLSLGLAPSWATVLQYAAGGVVLGAMLRAARRGDLPGSFSLAVAASLALSPIVWGHYLVLCLVPLALRAPRFSALWLATAWVLPDTTAFGSVRWFLIGTAVAGCALQVGAAQRLRLPVVPSVAVACTVCAALLFTGGSVARSALPRSVALVGPGANGAANLRLGNRSVCWTVWTQDVSGDALRLAFVTPSGSVVSTLSAQLAFRGHRAEGCRAERRAAAWRAQSKAGRFADRLAVLAPSGRVLLEGRLEDPVRARPGPLG